MSAGQLAILAICLLTVLPPVMNTDTPADNYADTGDGLHDRNWEIFGDQLSDKVNFDFLSANYQREHRKQNKRILEKISCKDEQNCRPKRSEEDPLDSEIVDYFTEGSSDVYTELDESEEDARMMQINELLKMIESQEKAGGESCTPGTELELGENIVDSYGKDRFHRSAMVFVNRANWLTRLWKYGNNTIGKSEFLLDSSLIEMLEFDDDIFAAGNCYDARQYGNYSLFCPYAYRLPNGSILAKDLAAEYNYLGNSSIWFYNARTKAQEIIDRNTPILRGFHQKIINASFILMDEEDILAVGYEDGEWHKPYYDCGGGNIWMMTYTVPFFGYNHNKEQYYFKGTSGLDIDLRVVDINQCHANTSSFNIFGGTDKCKKETTTCQPISGLGFRRGSYKCVCKKGFYFPDVYAEHKYYNGTIQEEEYEKKLMGANMTLYDLDSAFQCLECAEGCDECVDSSPCIVSLNMVLRSILLVLQCVIIGCLPVVVLFTYKYSQLKVIRAASPVLLRIIILGAFFIYSTTLVLYPRPHIITCTLRIWLREIGFALSYGALMLKTWRISVIFRVRSAKAVKITDMDLIKRLGAIVGMFVLFLIIRTLVSPPRVIIGRTADNLKAFLCESNWWDHSFTIMELMILLWGIRLCIMVRKAPSEFNESRFISMTIYNEFLLSIFLNVSMFFLQHPANPDLLYIIFFCHSQLTITILLCLIFASKFYLVMKGQGKELEEPTPVIKTFPNRPKPKTSLQLSNNSSVNGLDQIHMSEKDINAELEKMLLTLKLLQAKNASTGTISMSKRIMAIQEAFIQNTLGQTNPAISTSSNEISDKKPLPCVKDKPPLLLKNGDVKKQIKPVSINSEKTPLLLNNPTEENPKRHNENVSDTTVSTICIPDKVKAMKKPNSLILVPHQQNIHNMSNGLLKSGDGSLRMVHQCKRSQASTKEVQTEEKIDEWSLVSLMHHSGSDNSESYKSDIVSRECPHQKMAAISNMSEPPGDKCDTLASDHQPEGDTKNESEKIKHNNNVPESTSDPECKVRDEEMKECKARPPLLSNNLGQHGKTGSRQPQHTHRLVINLDDKNRFTDEVTV